MSSLILFLALATLATAAELPTVLFLANPMRSDNDVIRRPEPNVLSIAERHFEELSRGVFKVTITQDGTEVTREKLSRYQAVVFYTAIQPTDIDQEALIRWVREGGAFVGIHSTANTFQKNSEFGEMLGAFYDRRPWRTPTSPQVNVRVTVNDRLHPATQHLPATFEISDDIYQFKRFDPSKVHVLLSLDPASLDLENSKVNRADRQFPVSWTKHYGSGRVFYTALGDWEPVWQDPRYRIHLIQGIKWAIGAVAGN